MKYENTPGTRIPSFISRTECVSSGSSIAEEFVPKVMNGEQQQTSPEFTDRVRRCVEKDKLSSNVISLIMIIVDIIILVLTLSGFIYTVLSVKATSDIAGPLGVLAMLLFETGILFLLVWSMKTGKSDDRKIKESVDNCSFSIMKYRITDLKWYDSNLEGDNRRFYLETNSFHIEVPLQRYKNSCIREDIYAVIIFCENKSFFYLLEN